MTKLTDLTTRVIEILENRNIHCWRAIFKAPWENEERVKIIGYNKSTGIYVECWINFPKSAILMDTIRLMELFQAGAFPMLAFLDEKDLLHVISYEQWCEEI